VIFAIFLMKLPWFRQYLEEAPGAYKEIGAVMRAQKELVRVVRRLRPVLIYKGV
jgi:RNA-splicing ligase RtcB